MRFTETSSPLKTNQLLQSMGNIIRNIKAFIIASSN